MKNFAIIFLFIFSNFSFADYLVKHSVNEFGLLEVEDIQQIKKSIQEKARKVKSIPFYLAEDFKAPEGIYEEWIVREDSLNKSQKDFLNQKNDIEITWAGSEVKTLIDQGPTENRIDLTIVGDGYTSREKDKFFEDAQRLTDDLFAETTFATYLPLFNVHAVFVPSRQSGLSDMRRINTALGLYRSPRGSKRGIMPGNRQAAERALRLAPDADYPILMANDDFYGGLGGRYAITTRSLTSGSMVLRHELGHNFGDVGEEYDGGAVYSGANSSRGDDLKWGHWIEGEKKIFDTRFLAGRYVWQNLEGRPYRLNFDFPQSRTPLKFDIRISSVGWYSENDVHFFINGQKKDLKGLYTVDRSFFRLEELPDLEAGSHRLEFREQSRDGDNVLAFAQVLAHPSDIVTDNSYIGGYATFDSSGRKTYRPTFEGCLMRDMRIKTFCSVDKENMWLKFLARVSLIDDLEINRNVVTLKAPPLEGLEIRWFQGGVELEELRDLREVSLNQSGRYEVKVNFKTPEVRRYNNDFEVTKRFRI